MVIDVYKYKKYKHELGIVILSRYLHAGSESETTKFSRITHKSDSSNMTTRSKDKLNHNSPKMSNS